MKADPLAALAANFALLSLFAVGGAVAIVPEMHRQAVEVSGWMSDRQFADMFAIAQVAPGPNVILVTLIGYHVAGLSGALVATGAMCGPSCLLAYAVGRVWEKFKDAPWRVAIQAGLVPISVGLVAAGAFIVADTAIHNGVALAVAAVTGAIAFSTRVNPLWMFAAAALLGLAGLL